MWLKLSTVCLFILLFYYFCLASPLKKGEKGEIWKWPFYKAQLPVRCGKQEGLLDRNRMAKGHRNS